MWDHTHTVTRALIATFAVLTLTACSSKPSTGSKWQSLAKPDPSKSYSPRVVRPNARVPKGGGHRKLGKPYKIGNKWYTPRRDPHYQRSGIASWYGDKFHGRLTANGEAYDMNALTAAHPTMELPSYAWVTNLENRRTILVRVNDRGPYAHNRVIDLSRAVATALGSKHRGVARVNVRYAGPAPLSGDDTRERQHLARQPWYRNRYAAR